MKSHEIKELLDREPFRGFRIHVSDGSAHEIANRDLVFVTTDSIMVGVDPDESGLPRRTLYFDAHHITRIVPLKSTRQNNGRRRSR